MDARCAALCPRLARSGVSRYGSYHPFSIAYGSRPRLRTDSPAADEPCCGTLGHSVEGFLAPLALLIPAFALLAAPPPITRRLRCRPGRSPTMSPVYRRIRGFGGGLEPRWILGAGTPRPVSYYALFQGWLLLSQPPGCLRVPTTFPTKSALRDLSRRSGLFPSRRRIFAPAVSLPWHRPRGIRSLP
jgi:hypothetical protein